MLSHWQHPNGTTFRHHGSLIERLLSWRVWLWCWRHGFRPKREAGDGG